MLSNSLLCILLFITLLSPTNSKPTKIHVVPHTHNDAGWIWTFDDYYYGQNGSSASVKKFLDNMVLSLFDKTDRTFIYVEMSFFTKWYKDQSNETKQKVKQLLQEERFEFINGGYVMHDEATTYYQHVIDQMRLGLLFLKSEFDFVPKVAWFIDPFGHSAANAYIISQMGFSQIVFVRIDYKDKEIRRAQSKLEFYYYPFTNSNDNHSNKSPRIFTHVTYNHYCNPEGFDDFNSDRELHFTESDLNNRAELARDDLMKIASGYRGGNVMMMFGCDFSHNARDNDFLNVEKLMERVNLNYPDDLIMEYSTPSKYFKTIFENYKSWPEYNNIDFFPYADKPFTYWTGYFTSRPYLKGLVRETGNYLLMTSRFLFEYMLSSYSVNLEEVNKEEIKMTIDSLFHLRENLAICQHHDAVAGTAKEYTSKDYIKRLDESIEKVGKSVKQIFNNYLPLGKVNICPVRPTVHLECQSEIMNSKDNDSNSKNNNSNIATESQVVYIFNPGYNGEYPISFDYQDANIEVFSIKDKPITSYITCLDIKSQFPCKVNIKLNFNKSDLFIAVKLIKTSKSYAMAKSQLSSIDANINGKNIKFDTDSLNFSVSDSNNKDTYNFSLKNGYFTSYTGSTPDGAYIFTPNENRPKIYNLDKSKSFILTSKIDSSKNNLSFLQIVLRFENSYMIIKYISDYQFEVETLWDEINEDSLGKNYLLVLNSDIKNEIKIPKLSEPSLEMWTDSNGLKMMRRLKDYRIEYEYNVTQKIASNFYPVNFMASIRDRDGYVFDKNDNNPLNSSTNKNNKTERVLNLFNDRSQSIGMIEKGEMITILNRNSKQSIWKGLEEPLFETDSGKTRYGFFRTKHLVVLSDNYSPNFVRNYFNNKPFMFMEGVNYDSGIILSNFNADADEKNLNDNSNHNSFLKLRIPKINLSFKKSKLYKILTHTKNVDVNFHIIEVDRVFVQFTCLVDPYISKNNDLKEESFMFKNSDINYSVSEFNLAGVKEVLDNNGNPIKIEKEKVNVMNPQEFRLFMIVFG